MRNVFTEHLYEKLGGLTPFAFFAKTEQREKKVKSHKFDPVKNGQVEVDTEEQYNVSLPGAFTPLQSVADFKNQLKAPVLMPIFCLGATLYLCEETVRHFLTASFNLITLKFPQAADDAKEMVFVALGAIAFSLLAIVDTLSSLFILATRLCATAIASVGASADSTANGASVPTPVASQRADVPGETQDGDEDLARLGLSFGASL